MLKIYVIDGLEFHQKQGEIRPPINKEYLEEVINI